MVNKYCTTCQHERNSIGFCDKCCYSRLCEEKGLAPTMYEKRPSNADRIRAMSDEELADYLTWHSDNYSRYGMCWLDWLKQEATDD